MADEKENTHETSKARIRSELESMFDRDYWTNKYFCNEDVYCNPVLWQAVKEGMGGAASEALEEMYRELKGSPSYEQSDVERLLFSAREVAERSGLYKRAIDLAIEEGDLESAEEIARSNNLFAPDNNLLSPELKNRLQTAKKQKEAEMERLYEKMSAERRARERRLERLLDSGVWPPREQRAAGLGMVYRAGAVDAARNLAEALKK